MSSIKSANAGNVLAAKGDAPFPNEFQSATQKFIFLKGTILS